MSNPKYFYTPFAENGQRDVVPDIAGDPALVSYDQGWTPNYSQPKNSVGSENVGRLPTNGVLYDVTSALKQTQEQGILPWRDDVNYGINAVVMASNGFIYQSVVGSINEDPINDDPSFWLRVTPPAIFVQSLEQDVSTANTKNIILPAGVLGNLDIGQFPPFSVITYRNTLANTGPAVVNIVGNAAMQNIPVRNSINLAPLVGGEFLNGNETQLVFRPDINAPDGVFVLTNARASAATNTSGLCFLSNSLNSTAQNTAATSLAVRNAALSNNITYTLSGGGDFENVAIVDATNNFQQRWIAQSVTFTSTVQTIVVPISPAFPGLPVNVVIGAQSAGVSSVTPYCWVVTYDESTVTVRYKIIEFSATMVSGNILLHLIGY